MFWAMRGIFPFNRIGVDMKTETYNGWTNYATWRVMLEIFDGFDPREEFFGDWQEDLAANLKEYADMILDNGSSSGLALDYARAFMSEVNWHEIAQHMITDYSDDV